MQFRRHSEADVVAFQTGVAQQDRIRQNMAQLPKDSDLFRRYVTKFNEQEDKIDQLREQIKKAIADEAAGRDSLNKYLTELELT